MERNTYLEGTCIQNNYWKGTLHDNTCQVMLKKKAVADDHKEPKRTLQFWPTSIINSTLFMISTIHIPDTPLQLTRCLLQSINYSAWDAKAAIFKTD